jgi:hypothetical protein
MQTFKAELWESMESPPQEPFGGVIEPGFRAPGRIVLLVQQGTGWALRADGDREVLDVGSVVIYDTGEWVEYGSDGSGEAFRTELYGAANFSQEQAAARMAHFYQAS